MNQSTRIWFFCLFVLTISVKKKKEQKNSVPLNFSEILTIECKLSSHQNL